MVAEIWRSGARVKADARERIVVIVAVFADAFM